MRNILSLVLIAVSVIAGSAIMYAYDSGEIPPGNVLMFNGLIAFTFAGLFVGYGLHLSRHLISKLTWADVLAGRRTKYFVVGTALLLAAISFHASVAGPIDRGVALVTAVAVGAGLLDLVLLRWRVSRDYYGDNRAEAEELLRFMTRRDGDPDPPWRAVRDPLEARETASAAAADAVAGR